MSAIQQLVKQAIATGYLTIEAENELKQLFNRQYDLDDIKALTKLQQATTHGFVRQESREFKRA